MSKQSKPQAVILHGLYCHYEMIGSVIEQFKDKYELHFFRLPIPSYTEEAESWLRMYENRITLPKIVNDLDDVMSLKPELCIIHTDSDKWAGQMYKTFFPGVPVIIVRHLDVPIRTGLEIDDKTHVMTIQGVKDSRKQVWTSMWRGVTVEEKMNKLKMNGGRPLICVLGDIINEEPNFLKNMMNRITNFKDVNVFIANRIEPLQEKELYASLSNVMFVANCTAVFMYEMLMRADYVYFFANSRGTHSSSASFPISFTMLCRMLSCSRCKDQYDLTSPLFYDMEDKFEVKALTKDDLELVDSERTKWIERTREVIKSIGV